MATVNQREAAASRLLKAEPLVQGGKISCSKEQLTALLIAAAPSIRALKGPHFETVGKSGKA